MPGGHARFKTSERSNKAAYFVMAMHVRRPFVMFDHSSEAASIRLAAEGNEGEEQWWQLLLGSNRPARPTDAPGLVAIEAPAIWVRRRMR